MLIYKLYAPFSERQSGASSWAYILQMLIKRFGKFMQARIITPGAEEVIGCLCRERHRAQRAQPWVGNRRRRKALIDVSVVQGIELQIQEVQWIRPPGLL